MLKDIAPKAAANGIRRARTLRQAMTLPEVLVWQILRTRPGGLKFRRQHPCGPYVLDFYCNDARLAIEVDGEVHGRADQPVRDARRDAALLDMGIATLRIAAADVLRDLDAAIRHVVAVATTRLPLHHPAVPGGPPPRDELGEE